MTLALAVDGGASKTDLALLTGDGELLSLVRGPLSSPHHVGLDASLDVLDRLLDDALRQAGLERDGKPVADVGRVLMAGADLPSEELALQAAVELRGWAERLQAGNDTLAVLRAGTERGWGVAVVCGTGINCVGVGPDGAQVRFPALGLISGDWGGGYDVGLAGLTAAARASDGRGPTTALEQSVPAHFGLETPLELAEAIHMGGVERTRLGELTRVVWAECVAGDHEACGIVDRLAFEVLSFVRAAIGRLGLRDERVEVVLGGTLLRTAPPHLLDRVRGGLAVVAPEAVVIVPDSPPIAGAALLALDDLAADEEAKARARGALTEAAARLVDGDG
jgi:N-acetylglucosamine kinase-like BadF-type ATPase